MDQIRLILSPEKNRSEKVPLIVRGGMGEGGSADLKLRPGVGVVPSIAGLLPIVAWPIPRIGAWDSATWDVHAPGGSARAFPGPEPAPLGGPGTRVPEGGPMCRPRINPLCVPTDTRMLTPSTRAKAFLFHIVRMLSRFDRDTASHRSPSPLAMFGGLKRWVNGLRGVAGVLQRVQRWWPMPSYHRSWIPWVS